MINAKHELLEHLQGKDVVKCAWFRDYDSDYSFTKGNIWKLRENYSKREWEDLIASLDFEYHNGFGGQNLFGIIWYEDGTWSSRGEYDGSEWWEYNELPEIPKFLK